MIPAVEAFQVLNEDNSATVFDAWYLTGTTASQDPDLVNLERDLFLTPVAVGTN